METNLLGTLNQYSFLLLITSPASVVINRSIGKGC